MQQQEFIERVSFILEMWTGSEIRIASVTHDVQFCEDRLFGYLKEVVLLIELMCLLCLLFKCDFVACRCFHVAVLSSCVVLL